MIKKNRKSEKLSKISNSIKIKFTIKNVIMSHLTEEDNFFEARKGIFYLGETRVNALKFVYLHFV